MRAAILLLALAGCSRALSPGGAGGRDAVAPAPVDGMAGDVAASSPFPVQYSGAAIVLGSERTVTQVGTSWTLRYYTNPAYRCGRQGVFSFLVAERSDVAGKAAPLWVILHGGGVGYYDAGGRYHGQEEMNDQESADFFADELARHALDGGQVKETIVGGRARAGYRFLLPSMCDHDLYAGMGNAYPNNPRGPDTVDGLRATMAAIEFTARGNGALAGYPTTLVFLHGTSAGSAGAYHVSQAFQRQGVRLTGALLDSYLVSERTAALFGHGCTPQETGDPTGTFSMDEVARKIGPFAADPSLMAERTVAGGAGRVPLFDLVLSGDAHCCGTAPLIAAAQQAGYANNCRFVHGLLATAMDGQPGGLHGHLVVEGKGHVISDDAGSHQAALQAWLDAILASAPAPPWPG